MDPGLETIRLPQLRQPAPGKDKGVLQRILGQTRIAQDPVGDRVERVADLVHQDGERFTICPTGPLDEVCVHLTSDRGNRVAAINQSDWQQTRNVQIPFEMR